MAPVSPRGRRPLPPQPRRAALLFLLLSGLLLAGGLFLSRHQVRRWHPLPPDTLYEEACGECHWAFHPSLLPAASWRALLAGLDDHFGENASLDGRSRERVAAYLTGQASEAWGTEAANKLRPVDPAQPERITRAPYWIRKHEWIGKPLYADPKVGSPIHCPACHADALSGLFEDQAIHIPTSQEESRP